MRNKNISRFLADIKHPAPRIYVTSKTPKFELPGVFANRKKFNSIRFVAILFVLIFSSAGITAWGARENAIGQALTAYRNFIASSESVKQLSVNGIESVFKKEEESLDLLDIYSKILGFVPAFREIPIFMSALSDFNKESLAITNETNFLKKEWFSFIWEDGQKLISKLENIRERIKYMTDSFTKIRNGLVAFKIPTETTADYLTLHSKMTETDSLLGGVIDLLKNGGNIVILFMNNSEIRATGGFIGSYAVLKINEGEIKEMSVNDISHSDEFLEEKIIPPSPMMGATTDWKTRDANWFFDFPTSASKIISFMEKSSVYANKGIKFDGVIAMNHKTITDILKLTGPIELPNYGIVLDHTNFLAEIQKEVSRDAISRRRTRKNVLKSFLPELISQMKKMSDRNQEELIKIAEKRFNNKDIQAYFIDSRLQAFISNSLWGGEVYEMRESAYEDYLAVVVSNIGGEKSDAYMRQKVSLRSVIENTGAITNTLFVTREHEGNRATESFYRAKNQTYIRALVPKGANLLSVEGKTARTVRPRINYNKSEHKRDPDIELFEKGIESDKTSLGQWLVVDSGDSRELVMQYKRPAIFSKNFRFVYEKQSGVDSIFSYSVQAPQGYIFKETGTSVYTYDNANLPTRLIIDLTLQAK